MYPYSLEQYADMMAKKDAEITRLKDAYRSIVDSYIKCMVTKCPANLLSAGQKELLKVIDELPTRA